MTRSPAPAPRRTLLVGYGKLGARLATRLLADGGEVIALRRSGGMLPDGVVGVSADLSAPLPTPLPAVEAMVVTLPPTGDVAGYRAALKNLAAALPAKPARTVFVSSTGVFEGTDAGAVPGHPISGHPITESDAPALGTARSRELYDGEQAAIELFDAIIVRPAGIYGPGRDFLLRKVREGAAVSHRRQTNRIHETDLVRAIDELLRMAEPPRLVHAVDAASAPLGDVVGFIARTLGVDIPPDDPAAAPSGLVHDGTLLRSVLGSLEHPTYESGYAQMIAESAPPHP